LKSTGLAEFSGLWETVGVKKPHLELMGGDGNKPLWGYCSACEDVKFPPDDKPSSQREQIRPLNALFETHSQEVHLLEGTSPAAARIVKEGD